MCVLAIHHGVLPPTINYREPGSGVRPRLRAERGARGARRRRPLECDGPRRPQRLRAARPRRTSALRRQLVRVERSDDVGRARAPPRPAGTCGFGMAITRMPGRLRGADAVVRVLDGRAAARVDAEPPRRLEVDVGRRLAARDLLGRDGRPRSTARARRARARVDQRPVRRRRERRAGTRGQAPHGVDRARRSAAVLAVARRASAGRPRR